MSWLGVAVQARLDVARFLMEKPGLAVQVRLSMDRLVPVRYCWVWQAEVRSRVTEQGCTGPREIGNP